MAELVIKFHKFLGESRFNWETGDFEWATSAEDVRMAVEWAGYAGQEVTGLCFEMGTCFGGSTFEGTEIYNYAQSLGVPIRTRILSFAASMATILMLAGDTCEIDASATLMVHGPAVDASGTVQDLQSSLKGLSDVRQALRDIYVARTGQSVETVEAWMSRDTFFSAEEALAVGLVTKVIPIAPKTAPVLTDAQASARRAKYAGIVARADQRLSARAAVPTPRAKANPGHPAAPIPMAKTKTPAGPAAGKKPAALTAEQKKNRAAVAALAKQLGVPVKMEGEAAEPTAVAVGTVLADGAGTLYTDGELAVDSAVFNDEALSVPTADEEYETEDGRILTVAGGIVTSIEDVEATDASTADVAALITAALAPLNKRLDEMAGKVEAFAKAVPAAPRARGGNGSQLPDDKTPKPRAKSAHHNTL